MPTYDLVPKDGVLLINDDGGSGYTDVDLGDYKDYVFGRYYFIKKKGTTSSITINAYTGQTIDDESTFTLGREESGVAIFTDFNAWHIAWTYRVSTDGTISVTTDEYTVDGAYRYVERDLATYGGLTVYLPAGAGFDLAALDISAIGRGGRITVYPATGETVLGRQQAIVHSGETFTLKFSGTDWRLI